MVICRRSQFINDLAIQTAGTNKAFVMQIGENVLTPSNESSTNLASFSNDQSETFIGKEFVLN